MAKHDIMLKVPQSISIGNTDIEILVKADDAVLGTLLLSRGGVDWTPKGNSVNRREMKWEKLAELLEELGTPKRKTAK